MTCSNGTYSARSKTAALGSRDITNYKMNYRQNNHPSITGKQSGGSELGLAKYISA